jgi:hypothetical protein
MIRLIGHLGEVINHLKGLANKEFAYEPLPNWRLQYFHLSKDSIEYNFDPSPTLNLVVGHSQLYKHYLSNGKWVYRLEEKLTPYTTIEQEMSTIRF